MRRRRRRVVVLASLVLLAGAVTGGVFGVRALLSGPLAPSPTCTIGAGSDPLQLEPEQAADAATIAAVAKRRGLADHAVTIALAAALQESKLRNLDYGDRDSVGIFQQRPSQGWGTPAQLIQPAYAAAAFFQHLEKVPGWRTLPVSVAAQRVQHSADGSAYASWEEQARVMARTLTGEDQGLLACRFSKAPPGRAAALAAAAGRELGPSWREPGSPARDWAVASWLVAHSSAYGVVEVSTRGRRWTSGSGRWRPATTTTGVSFRLAPPARRASRTPG